MPWGLLSLLANVSNGVKTHVINSVFLKIQKQNELGLAFENTPQTDKGELGCAVELSQPPNGANIYFYLIAESDNWERQTISIKERNVPARENSASWPISASLGRLLCQHLKRRKEAPFSSCSFVGPLFLFGPQTPPQVTQLSEGCGGRIGNGSSPLSPVREGFVWKRLNIIEANIISVHRLSYFFRDPFVGYVHFHKSFCMSLMLLTSTLLTESGQEEKEYSRAATSSCLKIFIGSLT